MGKLISIQKYDSPVKEGTGLLLTQRCFIPQEDSKINEGLSCMYTSAPLSSPSPSSSECSLPEGSFHSKRLLVSVQWRNVKLTANNGKSLLEGVSGSAMAGELTAIMGPSGAGKTTLLNVLSGFTRQKVFGQILVNGAERDMRVYRKQSCYIMQDDHLLPHLTVRESIYFAACLKIPSTISKKEKQKLVDKCMLSLGLTECQNNKARQLSGGERKRLCIAQELISNPLLIFLDEPTSGLDSSSCLQCIELLKSLAQEGRTIVCTIHQPSTKIFEMFDKLYMLQAGQCIYRGPTNELISFLSEQGLQCPQYHNPTDFVTEVATGEHGDWVQKLKSAMDSKGELEDNSMTSFTCTSGLSGKEQFQENYLEREYSGHSISSWNQFKVLTYRSLICTLREPIATQLRLLAHVLVGLLVGMLYFDTGNDASKILNNNGLLFYTLLFLILTAMMSTVLTFPAERTIFAREHLNRWYSTEIYFLAKTVSDIPFQILFPVIFCSILYWMTSQPAQLIRFLLFLCSSIMTSLISQSVALIIGAAASVQNSIFMAPIVTTPILLFSGFFITVDAIPPYLRWLSYLSYMRYCYQSVLLAVYSMGRPELFCDANFCPFIEPVDFLKRIGMFEENLYVDYAAMWVFLLVFRFVAYPVLWYKVVYNR